MVDGCCGLTSTGFWFTVTGTLDLNFARSNDVLEEIGAIGRFVSHLQFQGQPLHMNCFQHSKIEINVIFQRPADKRF